MGAIFKEGFLPVALAFAIQALSLFTPAGAQAAGESTDPISDGATYQPIVEKIERLTPQIVAEAMDKAGSLVCPSLKEVEARATNDDGVVDVYSNHAFSPEKGFNQDNPDELPDGNRSLGAPLTAGLDTNVLYIDNKGKAVRGRAYCTYSNLADKEKRPYPNALMVEVNEDLKISIALGKRTFDPTNGESSVSATGVQTYAILLKNNDEYGMSDSFTLILSMTQADVEILGPGFISRIRGGLEWKGEMVDSGKEAAPLPRIAFVKPTCFTFASPALGEK